MLHFHVDGMTCGHCEAAVTRAVRTVDPDARITVERKAGRVAVETTADPDAVQRVIEAEGYAASRKD